MVKTRCASEWIPAFALLACLHRDSRRSCQCWRFDTVSASFCCTRASQGCQVSRRLVHHNASILCPPLARLLGLLIFKPVDSSWVAEAG
ncbi:hypothetical protein BJY00DRAFT_279847 [Aspergillus carlsbadensis]|nr:hypothetical protein BJY00DRAFT_279847 [Aspergillus carlsbadensis]